MAALLGTNATKRAASPFSAIEQGEERGVSYDEYTLPSAVIGASDTIDLGLLPQGARVLEVALSFPDLGTTGALKLGWVLNAAADAADDDGFLTNVDLNTAADTVLMSTEANVPGFGKKFAAATIVRATMTAATTATSGTIKCAVYYTLE
jgi:hypothetical protein